MIRNIWLVMLSGLFLIAAWLLAWAKHDDYHRRQVGPYHIVMYTAPKNPQAGEIQIAFRLHDQTYKIITDAEVQATYQHEQDEQFTPFNLKPGPGKDYRSWVTWNRLGRYQLDLSINHPTWGSARATFVFQIAGKK